MTLDDFLRATVAVPEPDLRRAIVLALAVEPARTPEARARFYERAIGLLMTPTRTMPVAPAASDYATVLGTPRRPGSQSSEARSHPARLAAAS